MKLIIFGSTGRIGTHLLEQAIKEGHYVTAFVRNPGKIKINPNPNLRIVKGDVLDVASVESAMADHDAVLCSLGAGRKGRVRSEGTRNIIIAMQRTRVRRLICQTTLGAGDSNGNLNFFWKYIMFGLLLKEAFLDHELQEKYVFESQLDWTIVRPAAFTDGALTGVYQHGFGPDDKSITLKISCADVAHFMIKQLTEKAYLWKTPGLSY
ncbi:NAD(P)-dependent oxidoreductase [Chryseosolibacter indicus]|uniref:SDR family oxidoreductase n=1 Tax=Chryseosolibacter indicus TaxID=2782351 RepID=A0ABS5VTQ6_9BACT|nr:SDR family oxidoreductase [Chryseosolibacter indicus]MBT1704792.1 SDR family oxidoreductase [Chryseosolibacter indicus]